MKVIFLDVDGVLTHSKYKNTKKANLDPEKIKLLKQIIEQTNAEIVLTSNWKKTYIIDNEECHEEEYFILKEELHKQSIEIYDETKEIPLQLTVSPELLTKLPKQLLEQVKFDLQATRTGEIYNWLENNPEVEEFVILDDNSFEYKEMGYQNNFIQTNYYKNGLTEEHAQKAIKILNKSKVRKRKQNLLF